MQSKAALAALGLSLLTLPPATGQLPATNAGTNAVAPTAPAATEPSPQAAFAAEMAQAQAGDAQAQFQVAARYRDGNGVARDYAQSLAWLEKSAAQHDGTALGGLGWFYQNGLGVPKDAARAFAYFQQGAQLHDAYCERQLAECYRLGLGAARDPVFAAKWYREAGLQGDDYSQVRLGCAYVDGAGVPKDPKLAFTYFLHAAYDDFPWAQYNLGRCYYFGIFVRPDLAESYKWLKIAQPKYNDPAETALMTQLLKALTPDQLVQGNKLAQAWPRERTGGVQKSDLAIRFAGAHRVKFPFEYTERHIMIGVAVAGHPDLHFLVDTGCATTLIGDEAAARLHLTSNAYHPAQGSGRDLLLLAIARGQSIGLTGGLTLDHAALCVVGLSEFNGPLNLKADGFLGFDLLSRFVVSLDYVNHTIEFIDPAEFHGVAADAVLPLLHSDNQAFLDVQIENHGATSGPVRVQIDTGLDSALDLNHRVAEEHPQLQLNTGLMTQAFGLGGQSFSIETAVTALRLGEITLPGAVITVAQQNQGMWTSGLAGLMGNDILHRFDVTFDFPNGKLYLKKNSLFDGEYESSKTGLAVNLGADGKTLSVLDIVPGSAAARAAFHRGDVLVSIDGVDLATLSMEESRERFRSPGLHIVTVRRDGRSVTLQLAMGKFATPAAAK